MPIILMLDLWDPLSDCTNFFSSYFSYFLVCLLYFLEISSAISLSSSPLPTPSFFFFFNIFKLIVLWEFPSKWQHVLISCCRDLLWLETNNTAFYIWKSLPACCIVFISSQYILFIYFGGSFLLDAFLKYVVNFSHIFTFEVRRPVGWWPPSVTIWSCLGGIISVRKPPGSCLDIGGFIA